MPGLFYVLLNEAALAAGDSEMRNRLRVLTWALLFGLLAPAHAAIVNLGESDFAPHYDLGGDPTVSDIYRVTHAPGFFNDVFLFSLSSTIDVRLRGASIAPNPFTFIDRMRLFSDFGGDGPGLGDSLIAGDPNGSLFFIDELLPAGDYYFRVRGEASPFGGRYFFAAHTGPLAAPIPEPSTYALVLTGLLIVAFAIRRRRLAPARA